MNNKKWMVYFQKKWARRIQIFHSLRKTLWKELWKSSPEFCFQFHRQNIPVFHYLLSQQNTNFKWLSYSHAAPSLETWHHNQRRAQREVDVYRLVVAVFKAAICGIEGRQFSNFMHFVDYTSKNTKIIFFIEINAHLGSAINFWIFSMWKW